MVTPAGGPRTPPSGDGRFREGLGQAALLSELDRQLAVLASFESVGREEASALRARRDRLEEGKDDDVRLTEELGAAGQTIMAALERGEGVGSDPSGLVTVRVLGALERVEVLVSERAASLRDPDLLADAVKTAYAAAVGRLQQGIVEEVERVSQGRPLLVAWARSARARLDERAGALGVSRIEPTEEEDRERRSERPTPEADCGPLAGAPPSGQPGRCEPGGSPERVPGLSALG